MAVAVCGPVSVETLAASVGILKAGGALITLSGTPSEGWNRAIISRAAILIGSEQDRPHRWFSGRFLPIEQMLASGPKKGSPDFPVLPMESPAILVPSGTAGALRLTGFSHRAITNVISWLQQQTRAAAGSSTLQIKRPGTERFAHEIFLTWSTGGRLVVRPSSEQPEPVAEAMAREQVNRVFLSEAQLLQWKNDSTDNTVTQRVLREVIVHAGRAPLGDDFERLRQKLPDCSFLILYGGAETGVATGLLLNGGKFNQDRLPIGKPISNVQAFILDSELNPVPAGVPGRLFIAGESIGQPRSGNPAPETVTLPLGKAALCKVMETGDVARYLSDGNIDLIRSSRDRTHLDDWIIDLIALEKSLVQSGEVQDAALVLKERGGEPLTLIAYVQPVPGRKIQEDEIEAYLVRQLPSAALSFKVVIASELPRTSTRQIDYSRLSSQDAGTPAKGTFVAPQTSTQQLLAGIWCDVIGVEEAGIHDDFFDLGGHSVLVTQVSTRIRKVFEVDIGLRTLFEQPTIAELAETIEGILMEELDELSEEEAQRMAAEVGSPRKLQ
jgi:aryl carrier-like protein